MVHWSSPSSVGKIYEYTQSKYYASQTAACNRPYTYYIRSRYVTVAHRMNAYQRSPIRMDTPVLWSGIGPRSDYYTYSPSMMLHQVLMNLRNSYTYHIKLNHCQAKTADSYYMHIIQLIPGGHFDSKPHKHYSAVCLRFLQRVPPYTKQQSRAASMLYFMQKFHTYGEQRR